MTTRSNTGRRKCRHVIRWDNQNSYR